MFFLRNREHKSAAAIIKMEWRSEQIRVHSTAKSMGFRRYFPPSPLQRSLDDLWLRFGLKWPPSPTELCGPRRKKSLNEPAGIGGDWHTENRICTLLLFSCVENIRPNSLDVPLQVRTEWRASSKDEKIGTKRMIRVENGTIRFMLGSLGTFEYW